MLGKPLHVHYGVITEDKDGWQTIKATDGSRGANLNGMLRAKGGKVGDPVRLEYHKGSTYGLDYAFVDREQAIPVCPPECLCWPKGGR